MTERGLVPDLALLPGAMISLVSVIPGEVSFRRHPRLGGLLVLGFYGVLEDFGDPQMATRWRARGVFGFRRDPRDWGTMTRKGFEEA